MPRYPAIPEPARDVIEATAAVATGIWDEPLDGVHVVVGSGSVAGAQCPKRLPGHGCERSAPAANADHRVRR